MEAIKATTIHAAELPKAEGMLDFRLAIADFKLGGFKMPAMSSPALRPHKGETGGNGDSMNTA